MRKLGFYGKDDWGITDLQVTDLNTLIKSGRIKIIGVNNNNNNNNNISKTSNKESVLIPKPNINKSVIENTLDLQSLLKRFSHNCFDPKIDNETKIDDTPGNYIICLKSDSYLPKITIVPELIKFEDLDVIYTGIAGTSLRKRDFKQHFTGNNAGSSTLRKSLGCLFGYKLIPRDKDPNTGKTKFNFNDEEELTKWMLSNLVMYFHPTPHYKELEEQLIARFNPPLNLMGNSNIINTDFRKKLSNLRSNKKK